MFCHAIEIHMDCSIFVLNRFVALFRLKQTTNAAFFMHAHGLFYNVSNVV